MQKAGLGRSARTVQVSLTDREVLSTVELQHTKPSTILYLPKKHQVPFRGENQQLPPIRHGLKHDCTEVFEIDQKTAEAIGWQRVYPTVKSRHIDTKLGWQGGYSLVLVPNSSLKNIDEKEFSRQFPKPYDYLRTHKDRLEKRKSRWIKQGAFYTVFGVGDYSFSTYKVAWVRLGWKPRFALLEPVTLPNGDIKPIVPSDHFMFIPTEHFDYAKALVALLNSTPYQKALHLLSSRKKSSLPKKLISQLDLPSEEDWLAEDNS